MCTQHTHTYYIRTIGDPIEQRTVVHNEHKRTSDTGHAYTPESRVEAAKDSDVARLVGLSQGNFENQDGQPNDEQGHEVRNEEST